MGGSNKGLCWSLHKNAAIQEYLLQTQKSLVEIKEDIKIKFDTKIYFYFFQKAIFKKLS